MLNIQEIREIFNKLDVPVLDGSALTEHLFLKDILFEFIKEEFIKRYPKEFFPDSRNSIPNKYSPFTKENIKDWKKTRKKLNKFLKSNKILKISLKKNPELVSKIVSSHLVETLYCLERSIFWFFNYKYNLTNTFEPAGKQALYYSDFFIKVAIQKFLGLSILHTRYAGKVFVEIDWDKVIVIISAKGGWSADHKKIGQNFLELIKNVDLKNYPEVSNLFQSDDKHLSKITGISDEKLIKDHSNYRKEERVAFVYDYTNRKSDPFNYFYGTVGSYFSDVNNYCFLDGPDIYNDGSEYFAIHFLPDVYGSWGINEHFIGSLMKFLIKNLKKVNYLSRYFSMLSKKIEVPKAFNQEAKEIILSWF